MVSTTLITDEHEDIDTMKETSMHTAMDITQSSTLKRLPRCIKILKRLAQRKKKAAEDKDPDDPDSIHVRFHPEKLLPPERPPELPNSIVYRLITNQTTISPGL